MIDLILLENFQGRSGTFTLDKTNIITGGNGAGKSTIFKAISLLLMRKVPTDEVSDTVGDQFAAYCGDAAGHFSIEIQTEIGSLKRTWTQTKSTKKVTTQAEFNGAKIGANEDFMGLMMSPIFDTVTFWRSTPQKQIATLCSLAGVDPDRLREIDDAIDRANTAKRKASDEHKKAVNGMKDHEGEIQKLVESGRAKDGVNISQSKNEIAHIDKKMDELHDQSTKIKSLALEKKSREERIVVLSESMFTLSDELEQIVIPPPTMTTIDLERELEKLELKRTEYLTISSHQKRLEHLRTLAREPTPPAILPNDLELLREKVAKAEAGAGVSDEDTLGYAIGKKIFEAMRSLSPVISKDEREQCLGIVRMICGKYKANVEAGQKLPALDQVARWKTDIRNGESLRERYQIAYAEFLSRKKDVETLENDLIELGKVEFDQVHYDRVRDELSAVRRGKESIAKWKKRRDDIDSQIEKISTEMSDLLSIRDYVSDESNDSIIEKIDQLRATKQTLADSIVGVIEYEKLCELRDKKEIDVRDLLKASMSASNEEKQLISQKAALLGQVQDVLTARAEKVTDPASITFELPRTTKSTDRVRFWRHEPTGDKVERATLCGAEQVEFDLALAYALVGEGGVIHSECAELTEERMDNLVDRVKSLSDRGIQSFLVGHTLQRFSKQEGINFIDMDSK